MKNNTYMVFFGRLDSSSLKKLSNLKTIDIIFITEQPEQKKRANKCIDKDNYEN